MEICSVSFARIPSGGCQGKREKRRAVVACERDRALSKDCHLNLQKVSIAWPYRAGVDLDVVFSVFLDGFLLR